ncbi:coproporphyrinogen III oxidase [Lottiidibacillus patelloidae]|uniref:Heme chaperone HemW n=1 Tax=Lottiidibacillus patelloidae TaxID=2670334 RepID=A0A263BX45_9BACI|nr:radical SAM family heme chaperone HemW [Lottiidibacillus patelloidae]OZM57756.1 coproporphyrinogen III oxidase [Lottiidibacillus patelloidae]
MPEAIYIHIPFCEQICHYCDFNKVFLANQPVEEYLDALEKELIATLEKNPPQKIKTIFVGGGTPTSLNEQQLERFLSMIERHLLPFATSDLEFTFEANPNNGLHSKLSILKQGRVNRISYGVQTFDNELLKTIGRTHRKKDVFEAVEEAKKIGFTNISVDLMFSLPGQSFAQFEETLDTAFSLDIPHFSSYSLQVEPKTVFYNMRRKGKLALPAEDESATMFELLIDRMKEQGYKQYEISNFAKPGFESIHNLTYWNNEEYYGIGAGAHSYVANKRNANAGPLNKYINMVEETGFAYIDVHEVTKNESMEEELFLGLRRASGVSKKHFYNRYKVSIENIFGKQINDLKQRGLLQETDDFIQLTRAGFLLGNEVFQEFIGIS